MRDFLFRVAKYVYGWDHICPICGESFKAKREKWSARVVGKVNKLPTQVCYSPGCNYAAGALNVGRTGHPEIGQELIWCPGDALSAIIAEAAVDRWTAWKDIGEEFCQKCRVCKDVFDARHGKNPAPITRPKERNG